MPIGKCLQRCIGQFTGVQPPSERKAALSACQVERQRRLDDGSRRLEHRGGDSHAPIGRHELVALGDHFIHFEGGIVHSETSFSLAATPNFAAQSFRYGQSTDSSISVRTSRSCISEPESRAQTSFERIRSSRLVIHVDIPANSTDLRRSNSACRYSGFFRTIT